MTTEATSHRSLPSHTEREEISITEDLADYLQQYAREKPEVVALWTFAIGFVLGWKLKPW